MKHRQVGKNIPELQLVLSKNAKTLIGTLDVFLVHSSITL